MASQGASGPPLEFALPSVEISLAHKGGRGAPSNYEITIAGDGHGSYVESGAGDTTTTTLSVAPHQCSN